MPKFTFLVTVDVQEDIAKKYPNYNINYENHEEFATSLVESLDTDENSHFGFEVIVDTLTRDQLKLITTE